MNFTFFASYRRSKSVNDLYLLCGKKRNSEATKFSVAVSHDNRSDGGHRPNTAGLRNLVFYPVIEVGNSPTVIQ